MYLQLNFAASCVAAFLGRRLQTAVVAGGKAATP